MLALLWRQNRALPDVKLEWRGPTLITTEWVNRLGLDIADIETRIAVIQGPKGEKGDPGNVTGGTIAFNWTQSNPQTTWIIPHNLNKHPSVTTVDNADRVVYGDVSYVDVNVLQVDFAVPMSGKAYIV